MAEKRAIRQVRTHIFNGVRYNIHFYPPLIGACDFPRQKDATPDIDIMCNSGSKEELIAIIHESLHAENYSTNEEIIDRISKEIGSFLWRLNFRRQK